MLLLPLDSTPAKVFTVQLGDGNKYVIETRYNEGFLGDGGFWTFDLSRSIDGVVLVTGVPILLGQDLLSPYALGIGVLVAIDENNTDTDAGPEDLGVRVNVYWATSDELAAAAAAAPPPRIATVVVPVMSTVIPPVPPPFTPLSLGSTLKLWLRGDLGVTQSAGNVTLIADQSGNGNDVGNVGTIPFVASSINGRPGWTHSAGTAHLTNLTTNLFAAGSPRTIFVVSKASTEAGGPLLESRLSFITSTYYQGGTGYGFAGGVFTDSADGTRNATISAASIANRPAITQFSCASAVAFLVMKINGASQSISQTNGCQAETGPAGFSIGYGPAAGAAYLGDICEVIVCDTVLSAQNELLTRAYLSARYGIG